MKKIIQGIVKLSTLVATWISFINLRGAVLIAGLLLALVTPQHDIVTKLDSLFLKANSYLFKSPLGSSDISIIEVPKTEVSIWQSDIHASGKLALLLSNVLNSPNTTVGLILEQPIDTGSGAVDVLIEAYVKENISTDTHKRANALVDKKFILMDLLTNQRVVIGVENFIFTGQKPLLTDSDVQHQIPEYAEDLLWKECEFCFSSLKAMEVERPKIEQHTLITPRSPLFQALFHSDQGETFSGFLIAFLRAASGISADTNLVWKREASLSIGKLNLPISRAGEFIPVNTLSDRLHPFINTIPLNEALARSAFPDFIFIADAGNEVALDFANALYSIQHDSVLYSPWWQAPILALLLLIITLYLVFVVGKISLRIASIVSLCMALSLIIAQTIFLVSRGFWLPMSLPLIWILGGHFLLVIWVVKKRRIFGLVNRAEDICIGQARELIKQKQLDQAVTQLNSCSPKDTLLQTLYDISEAYTEEKNYAKAVDILNSIRKKRKSFKDTEQKLQVLTTMLKTSEADEGEDYLQQTIVIADQKENDTLGRYQLEREIGRGAMGKVYLGFDPRISRRLAIKTLSYEHFKGKERQSIQSRFFREAEAAGRLNHPSIVSVYDVGEDNDQAFIAMDFAEGKALNNFVNADNLLPVFEVYRIVCDVAVALEYAHGNNIVHRDVKPGNIIYNPSPYQVKVTDFGIARLTDDSKTSTGEILGSPLYMAPEQLKGEKVNRAADIFSLGVTFYQLLTGRLPYSGDNLAALTYEIIHGKHKNVRTVRKDLPASASRIINQALQKNVADRYETAAEMAVVLKKAIKRDFATEAKRVGYI